MTFGKIKMNSGAEVLFEVSGPVTGRVSSDGVATKLQKDFGDIMNVVKETAESAHNGLQNIEKAARPDEYEINFGLKLTASAGIVFAQAGSEGSFGITLRWNNK